MTGRMDFLSVNLDSLPTSNLRTEEELKKYTLDENLESKPIEKSLHLLSTGDDTQKISVITSLIELYRYDSVGCLQKVIPRIQQNLPGSNTEYHLCYCASIRALLDAKVMPLDTFATAFLQTIMLGLDHRDSQVVDTWVECLVYLIPSLPLNTLLKEIKPLAIAKAAPTKSVHMRIVSCKVIGGLCKKLPGPEVDKELIPVIIPLWRDPSPDVRSTMIRQLPFIVRAIGSISDTEYIIGPFVQLVSDELPKVAEVAFGAMVESIPYFTVDNLKESIWPLLREIIIQAFKFDYNLLLVVAEQYGKMALGLERAVPSSEKEVYVKHYVSMLEKASDKSTRMVGRNRMGPEISAACRKHVAANYKEMAKFSYNENSRALLDQLHPILGDLINDHFWECRKTIASDMYEIIIIYGKYNYILKKELNQILNDNLVEVIDGLTPSLAEILVIFVKAGYYHKDLVEPQSSELLKSLEQCENTLSVGYNWRAYCRFINQMEVMWYIFSPDIVYNKFIDLFFKRLNTCKVLQTRIFLLRAILVNLKYIPRVLYKAEAKNKILDLSSSPNFYDRSLFIQVFDALTDIHSIVFIKDNYFLRLVQMAEDNVPNIRWAICSLLPKLFALLKLPEDKILMSILEEVIQQLSNDKDKEIQEMLKKAKSEIESSVVQHTFPKDHSNYEEEKQLQNLTPKQIQAFPESVFSLFEPTVLGSSVIKHNMEQEDYAEPVNTAVSPKRRSGRAYPSRAGASGSSSSSTSSELPPHTRENGNYNWRPARRVHLYSSGQQSGNENQADRYLQEGVVNGLQSGIRSGCCVSFDRVPK